MKPKIESAQTYLRNHETIIFGEIRGWYVQINRSVFIWVSNWDDAVKEALKYAKTGVV